MVALPENPNVPIPHAVLVKNSGYAETLRLIAHDHLTEVAFHAAANGRGDEHSARIKVRVPIDGDLQAFVDSLQAMLDRRKARIDAAPLFYARLVTPPWQPSYQEAYEVTRELCLVADGQVLNSHRDHEVLGAGEKWRLMETFEFVKDTPTGWSDEHGRPILHVRHRF